MIFSEIITSFIKFHMLLFIGQVKILRTIISIELLISNLFSELTLSINIMLG